MRSKSESQGTKNLGSMFKHIPKSVLELIVSGEVDLKVEAENEIRTRRANQYNKTPVTVWHDKHVLTPAEVCRCPFDNRFKRAVNGCTWNELKEIWNILLIERFGDNRFELRYRISTKLKYVDEVRNLRLNKKTVLWKPN